MHFFLPMGSLSGRLGSYLSFFFRFLLLLGSGGHVGEVGDLVVVGGPSFGRGARPGALVVIEARLALGA